ncbi:cyclic lactone autoinducer peptide [Virgibacillus sp. MSJ-26]|uniref:cyclic lactone autoinducer peptide n=1 Tax=Virgibacillus sp. MSJ-26 TaxID=2841522 RepID=UPI001C1077FB|nr:cyclic lactone autoinducer peptide [Virgibacillus sp. MSJ-26]MBU5467367.1 cyclic lactone autoinducer peptide [Virgibacillus sp. MSJ-26]
MMKIIKGNFFKTILTGMVSTLGTTIASASMNLSCSIFVYEPEFPEELKEEVK